MYDMGGTMFMSFVCRETRTLFHAKIASLFLIYGSVFK